MSSLSTFLSICNRSKISSQCKLRHVGLIYVLVQEKQGTKSSTRCTCGKPKTGSASEAQTHSCTMQPWRPVEGAFRAVGS